MALEVQRAALTSQCDELAASVSDLTVREATAKAEAKLLLSEKQRLEGSALANERTISRLEGNVKVVCLCHPAYMLT